MEVDPTALSLNLIFGVVFVDIILSGDNAVVIALACRSLDKDHRGKAMWWGVIGAFFARLIFSGFASLVMSIPLIKLFGGFLLLKIAISLITDNADDDYPSVDNPHSVAENILSAVKTIVLADIVMSVDNVLALTAITQNNFQMLMIGLLISIPILMFGSIYLSRLLDMYPKLLWLGGAVLGAVAGSLIIDDPIFGSNFVNSSSVASSIVPAIVALYTVLQGKIILQNRLRLSLDTAPNSLWGIFNSKPKSKNDIDCPTVELMKFDSVSNDFPELKVTDQSSPPHASSIENGIDATSNQNFLKKVYLTVFGVLMLTGLIFVVSRFIGRGTLLPIPEGYITFQCTSPDMVVNYRENAPNIRFATKNGTISTSVVQGRIIWDDYRSAGLALGIPPPIHVSSIATSVIVVNGGMFEHKTCIQLK